MLAVKTANLTKVFRVGLWRKAVKTLDNLNLEVEAGEVFGYLGPNGAGKTTTFKLLLGLIRPTSGQAWLLDKNIKDKDSKQEVGFLPEQPYFYNHLTSEEFLDFYAQFYNLRKSERRRRVEMLLELVGLSEAAKSQMRHFSRGMLQRIGIAQALINDPRLVILDEPMSGLDPIGRKQIRDLILRLKAEGKTVVYSSHILPDVELVSDRVAILVRGKLRGVGQLEELLGPREKSMEVCVEGLDEIGIAKITQISSDLYRRSDRVIANVDGKMDLEKLQSVISVHGGKLISFMPRLESLEDLFAKKVKEENIENGT